MRRIALALAVALALGSAAAAQPFDIRDQDWRVYRTEHYDVIFPAALEARAAYVADSLEYLFPIWQETLKPETHYRYPVILYPDTLESNGFVAMLPRRSAYFMTPYADESMEWLSSLAVHEGRHMTQYDALDRSAARTLYWMLGETGYALGLLGMPGWFLEGDAVMTETVLSDSGRGRDPSFTAQFKALLLDDVRLPYDKALLGSHADYVTNEYVLGYLMYAWLRDGHDPLAAETLLEAMARYPMPLIGPAVGMRRAAGTTIYAAYTSMVEEYRAFWKDQVAALSPTPATPLPTRRDTRYTRVADLAVLSDGSAAAAIYDSNGPRLSILRDGVPERVLARALPANGLSAGGGLLAWDETLYDARYGTATGRVVVADAETGARRTLAVGRLLDPELTREGARLAVLEWRTDYSGDLLVLDTATGAELDRFPLPDGEFWCDFSWSEDGSAIVFVAKGDRGKALRRLDLDARVAETLLDWSTENLRQPRVEDGVVYYGSDWSGIDGIYALDPDGHRWRVVSRPIGAYNPNPVSGGDDILFVDHADSRGMVVALATVPRSGWEPLESVPVMREEFYTAAAAAEPAAGTYVPALVPRVERESKPYSFALQGNRLHSWGVQSLGDYLFQPSVLGAYVLVDNIAGTSSHQFNLLYGVQDGAVAVQYAFGLHRYPVELSFQGGVDLTSFLYDAPYGYVGAAAELPIGRGVSGGFSWAVTPGTSAYAEFGYDAGGPSFPLAHYLSASADMGRWAAGLAASWEYRPLDGEYVDHILATLELGAPGLLRRDSFAASAGFEGAVDGVTPSLPMARGWEAEDLPNVAAMAGIRYTVPLLYPDLAIGPFLYVPEVSARVFAERTWDLYGGDAYTSAGFELLLDVVPLRLPLELETGLRCSWLFETGAWNLQFLLAGVAMALE